MGPLELLCVRSPPEAAVPARNGAIAKWAECDGEPARVVDACFAGRAWCGCRGVICVVAATVAVATASAVAATLTAAAPPPPSSALKQAIVPPTLTNVRASWDVIKKQALGATKKVTLLIF